MASAHKPFQSIVLAGERPGGSPLGHACGVAASVLVPVDGQTALARVVAALDDSQCVANVTLSGPASTVIEDCPDLRQILERHAWLAPASGPAQSSLAAMDQINDYPILLTSGDHALLSPAIIDRFCEQVRDLDFDAVVGLVPYRLVLQAFPRSKRTVMRFADEPCCGSNLFAFLTDRGRRAVDFWQQVQSLRKRPWRIAALLGPGLLFRYLAGRCRIQDAIDVLSERAGCRLGFVLIENPRVAVDVDSLDDLRLAEHILKADAKGPIKPP
jgi:molybdopterin-guanine dinucleotide biosynthesis protein A